MNKSGVIKITGLLVIPFLVLTVAMYFLYPYLNEEKYKEVVAKYKDDGKRVERLAPHERTVSAGEETSSITPERDFDTLSGQIEALKSQNIDLQTRLDSVRTLNKELQQKLDKKAKALNESKQNPGNALVKQNQPQASGFVETANQNGQKQTQDTEAFSERVKSLLNLDEEQLAPIVNQMSNDQLIKLYRGGGTIQREKLLRSLKPDRAAKIMTEIML